MIKKKELIILLTIIALDLVTKIVAYNCLPFRQDVNIIGDKVVFHLVYNENSTGFRSAYFYQNDENRNLTLILGSILMLISLSYILFIKSKKVRILYKILIGIALFLIISMLLAIVALLLINLNISTWGAAVVGTLSTLIFYSSIFYFVKDKLIRYSLILIIACWIGNFISYFYPPFFIINFIRIDKLYEFVSFNLAYLSRDIGLITVVISLLILK